MTSNDGRWGAEQAAKHFWVVSRRAADGAVEYATGFVVSDPPTRNLDQAKRFFQSEALRVEMALNSGSGGTAQEWDDYRTRHGYAGGR